MHVQNFQEHHFLRERQACGTLHNIVKGYQAQTMRSCQNEHLLPLTASRYEYFIYFLILLAASPASPCYKYHSVKQATDTIWDDCTKKLHCWRESITLLDVVSFLKKIRIVGKSSAHPVGMFGMLPNPPQCNIQHKIIKSTIVMIKLKLP